VQIEQVDVIPFKIPLIKPLTWAAGHMTEVDWLIVLIRGSDGVTGVAEAIPRPMIYGETQESVYAAISRYLAPAIVGEDSLALERVWARMGVITGNLAAKAAIDVALHDLNARALGLPVHRMLGGPARDWVHLVWMVGLGSDDEMVAEVQDRAEAGYRSFKVKGGLDPQADVRRLRRMHAQAPPGTKFYIDANTAYDTATARRVLRELEEVLDCVEEPLPATDDQARLELARRAGVPIMGDESVFTVADVYRQIRLGALSRISLKVPRTGFWLSRKIVHLAEAARLPLQVSTQSETTLGTAACLSLAAAFQQISLPCELTFYQEVADSLLTSSPEVIDGRMRVPDRPGLAAELDWDKITQYACDGFPALRVAADFRH
jgi:L-Ala-D/L-Glu epimerase